MRTINQRKKRMIVKEVLTEKDRNAFFEFPLKLYKGNKYVVPSLISDEKDEFNPLVNDAYSYAESKMFIALDEKGKVIGRIAGILNRAYNKKQNVRQLRFSRFDVIDDFNVTKALFDKIFAWAKRAWHGRDCRPHRLFRSRQTGYAYRGVRSARYVSYHL